MCTGHVYDSVIDRCFNCAHGSSCIVGMFFVSLARFVVAERAFSLPPLGVIYMRLRDCAG